MGYGYGYGYGYGDGDGYRYGYGYHRRTWNGCPPGWTVRAETAHPTKAWTVVAGTPGMDAHPGTRFRVETVHPTDLEGEAAAKLLAKDGAADCGQHREAAGG